MFRRLLKGQLFRKLEFATSSVLGSDAWTGFATRYNVPPVHVLTGPFNQLCSLLRAKSTVVAAGLKAYKPTTPGFRGRIITSREGLWKGRPIKALTHGLKRAAGRSNTGRITIWHRGGGHKRLYRLIDFKRTASTLPGTIERFEYDPNRSARIALVNYAEEGARQAHYSYIIAPQQSKVGDRVQAGLGAAIKPGNTLPLSAIPVGLTIHNIELTPGRGGQLVRSAGTAAVLVGKGTNGYALIKLPSGEQRSVLDRCTATIGSVSNPLHKNQKLGKAGARRWKGRRPVVRGVAMNPVDHPHGGGRGKSKGRVSQSPWGVPCKGFRTRRKLNPLVHISRHDAKRARR